MLNQFEDTLKSFIIEIGTVMYDFGFSEVSVGTIMRLMGLPDENAAQHDNEFIQLDDKFEILAKAHNQRRKLEKIESIMPPGTTLQ